MTRSKEQEFIDQAIDTVIAKYQDNSQVLTQLVVEGALALTAASGQLRHLNDQSFLQRMWGNIMDQDDRLRDNVTNNLAIAQYTFLRMIQKTVEQNMLSLQLMRVIRDQEQQENDELKAELEELRLRIVAIEQKLDN